MTVARLARARLIPGVMAGLLLILLAGCEFGVDPSVVVKPNYQLLDQCARPADPRVTAIVADALCGTITVFEDRAAQSGRQIDLNVMLLPATTAVVKPDPIFFLAGGPGQSAVSAGPWVFGVLHKLRRERDVVLVDQRGTGESNSLMCIDDTTFELDDFDMSVEQAMEKQIAEMRACLSRLDANPAFYTTPIAMDDLNEVRERLGYRSINLLGGSYGTRAALVYVRRHPDSVRSMVLDGVVPLSMNIPANVATDAQAAFDALLADCGAQPDCANAFPRLGEHFRALVQRHATSTIKVTFTHPRTGERVDGTLDHRMFNRLIRNVLYERTLSSLLPLAIEQANHGNFDPLISLAFTMNGDEAGALSVGMMASVLCAEDMTRTSSANSSRDFENQIFESLEPICRFWPRGSVPVDYFEPVTSDVPALLLSGKLDPITPPRYGWEAAATLGHSQHIIVAGVGHGVMTQGCVPDLLAEFFEHADPGAINPGCTANLVRRDFFTSFAGPAKALPQRTRDQQQGDPGDD
ncbi:MAG: alpha/beta fold hydrolase [Proteobacteria bacterium]|jgi:pimeloyl-ACP methyl ester carboxylesterase|nr:alpha/beta fold hydrolase [Pseudomonadota bacterium]MDA1298726.1 alpha/beta fold hydrolase [Pseudomonadota bacterium]